VNSQKSIEKDLQGKKGMLTGKTIGVAFANQESVYTGTLVFDACDYCHLPVNAKAK
jgi:hypothetical protein